MKVVDLIFDLFQDTSDNLHVGVVVFGNAAKPVVNLGKVNKDDIERKINSMTHLNEHTNVASGLELANSVSSLHKVRLIYTIL